MPGQSRVRVRRVYDARTPEDGNRVLVDRLWPRGLSKQQADLAEFGRRYRSELDDPGRAAALGHLHTLAQQQPLTLLTATREADISDAAVLAALLDAESGTS